MIILKLHISPLKLNDLSELECSKEVEVFEKNEENTDSSNIEEPQRNIENEELKEFDCEVRLSHCSSLFESVRAKTLEDAIDYLKKAHPEALSIREADHWQ